MLNPYVSIYIPTKNRSKLLKRAIFSVLNQTYRNFELLIIDDCSDDDTKKVVQDIIINYNQVRYFKNPISRGANYCRNLAIIYAKGEFITGLDDDDIFLKDRIATFISKHNPNYSFFCSKLIFKNLNEVTIKGKGGEISWKDIKYNNYVGNQIFIERKKLLDIGGFDEELKACQDYDMWIRLIQKYGTAFQLNKPTTIIYESISNARITTGDNAFLGYLDFYKKHKSIMNRRERARKLFRIYEIRNKKISLRTKLIFSFNGITLSLLKFSLKGYFKP